MAGRKSKHTPQTIDILCKKIEDGLPDYLACAAAGVDVATFYRWLHEPDKREFSEAITRARARRVAFHVDNISKAAPQDWRASAWYLEHTESEFVKREHITLKADEGDPWADLKARLGSEVAGRVEDAGQDPESHNGETP